MNKEGFTHTWSDSRQLVDEGWEIVREEERPCIWLTTRWVCEPNWRWHLQWKRATKPCNKYHCSSRSFHPTHCHHSNILSTYPQSRVTTGGWIAYTPIHTNTYISTITTTWWTVCVSVQCKSTSCYPTKLAVKCALRHIHCTATLLGSQSLCCHYSISKLLPYSSQAITCTII